MTDVMPYLFRGLAEASCTGRALKWLDMGPQKMFTPPDDQQLPALSYRDRDTHTILSNVINLKGPHICDSMRAGSTRA